MAKRKADSKETQRPATNFPLAPSSSTTISASVSGSGLLRAIADTPIRQSTIATHSNHWTFSLLIKIPRKLVQKGVVYQMIMNRDRGRRVTPNMMAQKLA